MDLAAARRLSDLTNDFYTRVADSFSVTRQAPWRGWERVVALCDLEASRPDSLTVLDLACGNLRFERFLTQHTTGLQAWAVDVCDDLALPADDLPFEVHYQHLDLAHDPFGVRAPACDLCVSFGFMHHLPLPEQRQDVLNTLVGHARPQGLVAISFWQFERSPRLRAKATKLSGRGDYLLGWQHEEEVARYCHSFMDDEIDALVDAVGDKACEVERFSADGKSDDLNRYVILRVL